MSQSQIILPDFAPVPITTGDVVAAARAFKGLRYSETGTWVEFTENGDPTHGATNCFGLLFLVAVRLGLVPAEIFQLLAAAAAQEPLPFILMRFLVRNCTRLDQDTPVQAGDILLFRWPDIMPGEISLDRQNHHVAFFSDFRPVPAGSIIHAVDTDMNRRGGVYETVLNSHDATRIDRVYRMPVVN